MQTQLLQFCKDTTEVSSLPLLKITTKLTHFLPVKNKIPILWMNIIQIKEKRSQNLISKYQVGKKVQIAKSFPKIVNKEAT